MDKGPSCSLTQQMIDRYLPEAVDKHKVFYGAKVPIAPPEYWEELKRKLDLERDAEIV
jgi:hypothetical protein